MDLVKHGEAAYPAGAWVEYQYNKTEKGKDGEATTNPCMSGGGVIAGTITMDGAKMNVDGEVYNNPFEMVGLVILFFFLHTNSTGAYHWKTDEADVVNVPGRCCSWYNCSPFLDSPFLLIYFHNFNPYVFASFISVAFPQMVSLCCGSFHTLLHAFETAFSFHKHTNIPFCTLTHSFFTLLHAGRKSISNCLLFKLLDIHLIESTASSGTAQNGGVDNAGMEKGDEGKK